jgi:arginase
VYFDAHADLNVPESVSEGALDWMGMSHMLGEPGTVPSIASLGERTPLLVPEQVVVFGWDPGQATDHERTAIARTGLRTVPADEVEADPEAAALSVRGMVEPDCERMLVHFDVDVIDFTDLPLSENWGRNVGLSYDAAMRALTVLLASPRLAGVTVTELNPDHAKAEAGGLERFAEGLAQALGPDPR